MLMKKFEEPIVEVIRIATESVASEGGMDGISNGDMNYDKSN